MSEPLDWRAQSRRGEELYRTTMHRYGLTVQLLGVSVVAQVLSLALPLTPPWRAALITFGGVLLIGGVIALLAGKKVSREHAKSVDALLAIPHEAADGQVSERFEK